MLNLYSVHLMSIIVYSYKYAYFPKISHPGPAHTEKYPSGGINFLPPITHYDVVVCKRHRNRETPLYKM